MSSAFAAHICETVDQFLQTVVLVDDEAFRRAAALGEEREWEEHESDARPVGGQPLRAPASEPAADYLDVQATTEAFGQRGLVCAVLSPQTKEENREVKDPLLKSARRADLVVLDWNLNGDGGETTRGLVKGILKKDDGLERRLRVIAVYTGEPALGGIGEEMRKIVEETLPEHSVKQDENAPAFTCGPVRVTILAKEYVRNLPAVDRRQQVTVDKLPNRLRDEFGRLCNGLVAGAAVAAMAAIRGEAHRLLKALGPELDPAYLGQRASLNRPAEAERQLEELLTAEIGALLSDRQVGSHANLRRIEQWLKAQEGLGPGGLNDKITADERVRFLALGLGDDRITGHNQVTGRSKGDLRRIRDGATELFVSSPEAALAANRAFSERMIIRTRYSKPEPVLSLGSIVAKGDEFLLCVQPACDSVRLTEKRMFPFLKMTRVGGQQLRGAVLLRDRQRQDEWLALEVVEKPGNLVLVEFAATVDERVGAGKRSGRWEFVATDRRRYRWVADLKMAQAQRAVEKLARQFSRVGLAEPEFLRHDGER